MRVLPNDAASAPLTAADYTVPNVLMRALVGAATDLGADRDRIRISPDGRAVSLYLPSERAELIIEYRPDPDSAK